MSDTIGQWGEDKPPASGEGASSLFDRWLDAARPHAKLWRTILGAVAIVTVWMAWTAAVIGLVVLLAPVLGDDEVFDSDQLMNDLLTGATPATMLVLLTTFLGLWMGVWLAMRLCHGGQRTRTLFAPEGKIRRAEFAIGVAIVIAYVCASLALGLITGNAPYRSDLSFGTWALFAVPVVLLVYFQSTGEELAFRGYLVQQLGARFRNPLVWGLIPAVLFGLLHYSNTESEAFAIYYIAATTLFGLAAAATVWRTGSLAAAMGLHVGNNVFAFLVAGPDDAMASTQLWLWRAEDIVRISMFDLLAMAALLVYVLSPWAPFPRKTALFGRRRNETRAAP